jgi:hypothetical protein
MTNVATLMVAMNTLPDKTIKFLARHSHVAQFYQELVEQGKITLEQKNLIFTYLAQIVESDESIPAKFFASIVIESQNAEFSRQVFNELSQAPSDLAHAFRAATWGFLRACKTQYQLTIKDDLICFWFIICEAIWRLRQAFQASDDDFNWINDLE